ncbi:NAD(P)/FAD-dependent oxidoreductase [Marinoscillum pacificum]|uniref:NAD(P)/FAD-dependent oxidoreductase n=1 Tax=Marinoscillum pacificum TaxID=392723 RepID=UPI0021571304|nr:FAD-dependent monooxygenase [Marinoscillum pacificum]
MYDVIIVGGGLGGLISSILLSRGGLHTLLIEKNSYPFHRVCGEYISNEVIPFLEKHDLFPHELDPSSINELKLSSTNGSYFQRPLDLGGFGISRYVYDLWLAEKARESGVEILQNTEAQTITKTDNWEVITKSGSTYYGQIVIGAHGKRAKLDQKLKRPFLKDRSPFVGVKYHVKGNFDPTSISLHNFKGGYCGFSKVEGNTYNLCYLTHREPVKKHGSIQNFEKKVIMQNPHLNDIWKSGDFVFDSPFVINEISFKAKEPVFDGVLMIGDSAGMITPLAGNGMAMAIRSAALISEIILSNHVKGTINIAQIEKHYTSEWNRQFKAHLKRGQVIQKVFFSNPFSSNIAVLTGKLFGNITDIIIRQTHGEPFS